jgi:tetratricopeptide (TPR) repeat protein
MLDQLIFDPGNGYAKSIFVSSTFRDMQFERDMIASKVLPELREFAAQYGASISFTDLRWGVNTGELDEIESARKVLSVCLDEIDASKPYMLVLLGDRYGWIPDAVLLEKAAADKGYAPGELQKSVTALEIEYGALSRGNLDRCLFYFRHLPLEDMANEYSKVYSAEDLQHGEKQQRLKERIESVAKGRVRYYEAAWDAQNNLVTGLDDLCEMICSDVCAMMEREWGKNKDRSWQERSAVGFGLFLREKSSRCAGRDMLLSALKDGLLNGNEDLLILRGASGSGKSTILAALAQTLHNEGLSVFPFFCGNDARSTTVQDMLRQIIFYLETVLGQKRHFDEKATAARAELTGEFRRLVRLYQESGKPTMIIMADALDRLLQEDGLSRLGWLPLSAASNIRFVVSCTGDFSLPQELPGLRCRIEEIGPLPKESRREVIRTLLRADSKGLDDIVIRKIETLKGSDNPLYLSALLQRLIMLDNEDFEEIAKKSAQTKDDMKAINEYLIGVVDAMPETVWGVCTAILQEAGERISASFTNRITALLAASRFGLRKSDLMAILVWEGIAWSPLDFARFKKYMRGYFIDRPDGRIDFSHLIIRLGLSEKADDKNAGRAVLAHLKMLPEADPVRISEIVYHAYCCDDKVFLAGYLSHAGETALDIAAFELRNISMNITPAWFLELINGHVNKERMALSSFVVFNYANTFDTSQQDYKILKQTLLALNKVLVNITSLEARRHQLILYNRLATMELKEGDAAGAEKLYVQAEKIANELAASGYTPPEAPADYSQTHISADTGTAMLNTAAALEAQGRLDEALSRYKALLKVSEKIGRKFGKAVPRRDYVTCCERIGTVYLQKMDSKKALKYYSLGYAQCPALIAEEDTIHTRIMQATLTERLGNAYRAVGMFEEAEQMYRLSLEQAQKLTLETGSVEARNMLSIACEHLGVLAEIQGKNNDAIQMFEQALRIAMALAEEADTKKAWQRCSIAYERVANQQMKKRNLEGALENYQKSMEISKRLAEDSDSPIYQRDLTMGYHKLGTVYLELGQEQESCACFENDEDISGRIAKQLNTPDAYDEWAVAMYTLATHPAVPMTYRISLLNRSANIWEQLYRQTRNPDFLKKAEMCKRQL